MLMHVVSSDGLRVSDDLWVKVTREISTLLVVACADVVLYGLWDLEIGKLVKITFEETHTIKSVHFYRQDRS